MQTIGTVGWFKLTADRHPPYKSDAQQPPSTCMEVR